MTCAFSDDDSPNNGLSQLAMINKRRHQKGVLPGRLPGRGRDGSYLPPPAQIRTCRTTAYGSCLGYVTRSDPQGKDVHFWV